MLNKILFICSLVLVSKFALAQKNSNFVFKPCESEYSKGEYTDLLEKKARNNKGVKEELNEYMKFSFLCFKNSIQDYTQSSQSQTVKDKARILEMFRVK